MLKDNDFGRDPGAAPNFSTIQKMLDIYAETGMLPKLDASAHFPKFVLHCRATVHELRKGMATGKSMILVPLSI
jgi:hypothetical protein